MHVPSRSAVSEELRWKWRAAAVFPCSSSAFTWAPGYPSPLLKVESRCVLKGYYVSNALLQVGWGGINATCAVSAISLGYNLISFINTCRAAYNWNDATLAVGLWSRVAWFTPFPWILFWIYQGLITDFNQYLTVPCISHAPSTFTLGRKMPPFSRNIYSSGSFVRCRDSILSCTRWSYL